MIKISTILLLFFLSNLNLNAIEPKPDEKVELIIPDTKKPEGSWGKEADEVEAFQDIKIIDDLSEESTVARLEEARNHFNTSLAIFKAAEKQIKEKKELSSKESRPAEKYEWQKRAREIELEKEYKKISLEGRKNAVMELIKGMSALDKIENPSMLESQVYKDLKASIYREYIKHQFRMKNYNQAMDMIRMYLKIGENYEKEAEPHKLLAICYEFNERQAARYKRENLREKFNALKNRHLLRYAELAYGTESKQYETIKKKVKYQPIKQDKATSKKSELGESEKIEEDDEFLY